MGGWVRWCNGLAFVARGRLVKHLAAASCGTMWRKERVKSQCEVSPKNEQSMVGLVRGLVSEGVSCLESLESRVQTWKNKLRHYGLHLNINPRPCTCNP